MLHHDVELLFDLLLEEPVGFLKSFLIYLKLPRDELSTITDKERYECAKEKECLRLFSQKLEVCKDQFGFRVDVLIKRIDNYVV